MYRILFCILLAITSAIAGPTITLENAASYALTHNPQIAIARYRVAEARGRLLGAGRLTNPELEVELMQNTQMPDRAMEVAFTQRFPVTARLRLEKRVSQTQVAAAEAELRDAERRLTAEVRAAVVKVIAINAQRKLREQQLANSKEQTEFVNRRVAAAEASILDVTQLEVEAQQLAVELLQLDSNRASLIGELRPLLGVTTTDDLRISGELPPPAGATSGKGGQRPDLEAARLTAEAARQMTELERSKKWEDPGVGLFTSIERMEDAPEGRSNDYFLGLRFSLPLPLWNRNQGPIAEADAAAQRAEKEVDLLQLKIQGETESARGEMAALAKLIATMDSSLLPKAAQVEEQFRTAYSTGQTQLTEVLRARARRLELAQRRLDALRDYHLARIRYESARGYSGPGK